ncbi:MAG: PIG-L family deacetylase [Acidimicrobiia bacterium]|nr:PIG-L family deacetylase [Acidimicrobiia bacterium]
MPGLHPDLTDAATGGLPAPRRALAVAAHPDDAEFGAGGTLAKWAAAGAEVTILVITDGAKGSWDPTASPGDLVAARRAEQEAAAAALGAAAVGFLDYPDGELEYSLALRGRVCEWVRRVRPDVVLGHDPWQRYQLHPDHRVAGLACVDGVVAARDHLFFPDQVAAGLAAHRPGTLLLWSADEPNHWEDVSGTMEHKLAALLCHRSQGESTMGGAQDAEQARRDFEERLRRRAAAAGVAAGLAAAEAFRRITP